jgi:hypothetical protein
MLKTTINADTQKNNDHKKRSHESTKNEIGVS